MWKNEGKSDHPPPPFPCNPATANVLAQDFLLSFSYFQLVLLFQKIRMLKHVFFCLRWAKAKSIQAIHGL